MSTWRVIHQASFLHPEPDHAIQGAAFDAQLAAEFTELHRAIGRFNFVKDLFEHGEEKRIIPLRPNQFGGCCVVLASDIGYWVLDISHTITNTQ